MVGGVIAFLLAGVSGQHEAFARRLIFDFPDGVRGGIGKIQGMGTLSRGPAEDVALAKIKACGAPDVRASTLQVTHRFRIESDSTSIDQQVVSCVQSAVPYRFSVFVTGPNIERDDAPFRKFWASPSNSNNEAK